MVRYGIRGCPSEDARRQFFPRAHTGLMGLHVWGAERSMGGCLTDMEARSLSCMLALMPDDGLTRAHNWPHEMEIVIYAACAGAVGVIDQKIALLYPLHASPPHCCCRATLTSFSRGFHDVSRTHTQHTQNRFPGFLTSKKQASRARPPIGNTLPLPSPHCDAASQTPTLRTKETPETPPPQAVKLHICGYLLFLP